MSSVINAFVFSTFLLCYIRGSYSELCTDFRKDDLDGEEAEVCLAGCCGPVGEQYCCMRDDTYHLLVIGLPLIAVFIVLAALSYLSWYCKKKLRKNKESYSHVNNLPVHAPFLQLQSGVNVNTNNTRSTESTQRIPYTGYDTPPPSYASIYEQHSVNQVAEIVTLIDSSFTSNLSFSRTTRAHSIVSTTSSIRKNPPPSYSFDEPCEKNARAIRYYKQYDAPPPTYSTLCLLGSNDLP